VAAGVGLILIKDHPDAMPKLGPALGGVFAGKRKGAASVSLTGPLGPLVVPMAGDSVRQTVGTGAAAGTSSKGDIVATLGGLGAGASVTLSWDTEKAAGVGELYLKAIAYVTPPEPLVVAGGVVPLRATLDPSATGEVRLELLLPEGVRFLDSTPAPDGAGVLRWTLSVVARALVQVDAWLRLPEAAGSYPVVVEERIGDVLRGTATQTYVIDAAPAELALSLLQRLGALPLLNADDVARDRAVENLDVVRGLSSVFAAEALVRLVDAAEHVASIQGADVTLIRIDLGRLIRSWQARSVQ
jgi:hypothetical protein